MTQEAGRLRAWVGGALEPGLRGERFMRAAVIAAGPVNLVTVGFGLMGGAAGL